MKSILRCFIVIMIMMTSQIFAANVYYVDGTNGNDLNNGLSLETAWRTIAKANSTLQAGDTVNIRAGTYTEESYATINPSNSGSVGSYITYQNYPNEEAIITGTYHGAYLGTGKDYIKLDGITISGGNEESPNMDVWVRIFSSHNIIQNCEMFYASTDDMWQGIRVEASSSYNKILNNTLHHHGHPQPPYPEDTGNMIELVGDYNLVEGNDLSYAGHDCISIRGGEYNIIRNNYIHNPYGRCISLGAAESGDQTNRHNLIERNKICDAAGLDEGIAPNNGMQSSQPYAIIRFNEFYDNWGWGIDVFAFPDEAIPSFTKMYHNVFYRNGSAYEDGYNWMGEGIRITEHSATPPGEYRDVAIKNNILYKNSKLGIQFAESANPNDHIVENNFESGNPLFQNEANYNFQLGSGSPCIDAGTWLTNTTSSGEGTQIPVEDAGYFCDGFGIVEGDLIQLEGQTQAARITHVDHDNNIITIDTSLNWYSGQGVSLAYNGSAPDIGAYEYESDSALNVNINASPTSREVPLTVNFTGSATGGVLPYSYSWDFGDSTSSSEQNPSHTYNDPGDYTVNLTVTDSESNQDSDSLIINVSAIIIIPLVASCAASPTSGKVPLTVNFTGSATGGVLPYSYSWDFGDSTSSSEQIPAHTYSDPGDYTVTLTVTDSQSNQDSDSLIINVSVAAILLEALCAASPASGEVPLTVRFTGNASGGTPPYSYSWDFGDGTSSSEQIPTHTYNDAGDYAVYLTVTDSESNQDSDFLIINANAAIPPYLSCSPKSLYFGATTSGNETTDQYLRIINAGSGVITWNIEDDADWLFCSPSSGADRGEITVSVNAQGLSLGLYIATITVSSPEAYNSPQYVSVNFRVYEPEQENPPFGSLDTPVDGSTVSGSIPIAGWALDDIEVVRLEIKRNSDPVDLPEAIGSDGLVYIGDAVFVEGARPDVEKSYSDYPLNSRAGWGYMLLTNDLPYRGNGSFTIYGFAYDAGGHREEIGRKTILCDNINRIRPFGTIDTPKQGESIRGSEYINFRWALTPLPKTIPKDGSTIWVWVDGVQMGEAVYNQYREDIATLYPEYNNVPGAEGYYYLDTTQYENGVHTITWSAMDDGGEVDGIGSRYFSVDNIETGNVHVGRLGLKSIYQEDVEGRLRIGIKEVRRGYRLQVDNEWEINKKTMDKILTDEMDAKRGYRLRVDDRRRINKMGIFKIQPEEMETRRRYRLRVADRRNINTKDILRIKIEEMEPLRIVLEEGSGKNMKYIGWGENKWKALPIGSTLDREKGIFSWIPTPGFIGKYVLHFAITDGSYMSKPLRVVVNVIPKSYD